MDNQIVLSVVVLITFQLIKILITVIEWFTINTVKGYGKRQSLDSFYRVVSVLLSVTTVFIAIVLPTFPVICILLGINLVSLLLHYKRGVHRFDTGKLYDLVPSSRIMLLARLYLSVINVIILTYYVALFIFY